MDFLNSLNMSLLLSSMCLCLFYKLKSFEKILLADTSYTENDNQAFLGFSIILKFKIYFFVSAAILKIKRGVGRFHRQADFRYRNDI